MLRKYFRISDLPMQTAHRIYGRPLGICSWKWLLLVTATKRKLLVRCGSLAASTEGALVSTDQFSGQWTLDLAGTIGSIGIH